MASEPVTKKQKVETEESLLAEIDTCQNDIDALNEAASEEILKIEQKYNKLRKPFYEKRSTIISKVFVYIFKRFETPEIWPNIIHA